jgi:hypothetical protein
MFEEMENLDKKRSTDNHRPIYSKIYYCLAWI